MYLGIDYGKKRIGLAVGAIIPKPIEPIKNTGDIVFVVEKIYKIIQKYEIDKVVLGLPYRSQGEEGTTAPEIKKFAQYLEEKAGIEIIFEPEQFTTSEATMMLERQGKKFDGRSGEIDSIAAAIILEQYINSQSG